jgi:putative endonuclease
LTNRQNGIIYTGVARDLARRIWQHREGLGGVFSRRYGLKRLVWCEYHDTILGAAREDPEALAASMEGAANPRGEPRLG